MYRYASLPDPGLRRFFNNLVCPIAKDKFSGIDVSARVNTGAGKRDGKRRADGSRNIGNEAGADRYGILT